MPNDASSGPVKLRWERRKRVESVKPDVLEEADYQGGGGDYWPRCIYFNGLEAVKPDVVEEVDYPGRRRG
jgi:hypothetical protein